MPTKRMFDLIIGVNVAFVLALNLAKLAAHRWHVESPGSFLGSVGKAVKA